MSGPRVRRSTMLVGQILGCILVAARIYIAYLKLEVACRYQE